MQTRISVITPTRNMAHFLEPCILSILQQGYPNLEHIIVDGASTDNTREVLSRYPHLHWISEPDRGLSDALNKGIRMATGDVIGWCNADDLYLPGALIAANDFFESHSDIDVLYGDFRETDELGRSLRVRRATHFSPVLFHWLHVNLVPTPSAFWRRRIHDRDLWFDEQMRYAMDYDFLRRVESKGFRFEHTNILFADFRQHSGSLTAAGGQKCEHELIVRRDASRVWKNLGFGFSIVRECFMLGARGARTVEKCLRGYYLEQLNR